MFRDHPEADLLVAGGGIMQGYVARKGDRSYAVIYEEIEPL